MMASPESFSILVVDDQPDARDVLGRRLSKEGYAVGIAENGRAALTLMREERYNLILLDLAMPETDGFETLARIKAEPNWRDTIVIVLTASSDRDSVLRCLELGAADYLIKPFDFRELKVRLYSYLARSGARGAALQPFNLEGTRVLVVDDQPLNRDLIGRRLQQMGCLPRIVADGQEALEFLRNDSVDAILLDIVMPEVDGFAVLTALKGDVKLRQIPVVIMSALDDSETMGRCFEAGADDYLTKPISPVQLRTRLSQCLAIAQAREQADDRERKLRELAELGESLRSEQGPG